MKKTSILVVAAMTAASLAAATVDSVSFTQDWPWSTDIKITYSLSGVTAPVDITVETLDGDTAIPIATHNALKGDICGVANNGSHEILLDPVRAFGKSRKAYSAFKVRLTASDSTASADEVLYKIFDIVAGSCTDVKRKDLVNGKYGDYETDYSKIAPNFTTSLDDVIIWTGVTNNIAYKTTHLVMRKINAANKVWQSGDPDGTLTSKALVAPLCHVKLTYDYYIAVFETTVAQHARMNNTASTSVSALPRNGDGVNIDALYGHPTAADSQYLTVTSREHLTFPTNSYVRDVGGSTPLAKLWSRTRNAGHVYEFTLPTRAEWEFAARGGNDGVLYSGEAQTLENVNKLAWHYGNSGGARQDVGTKLPNAYGLYDVLGNVIERVCSVGQFSAGQSEAGTQEDPYVNPIGSRNPIWTTSTHNDPALMGGGGTFDSSNGDWQDCRPCPARLWVEWWRTSPTLGYRLVIPARADGQWADHPAQ